MATLLIVDDDMLFCEALSTTLEGEGYRVLLAHNLARARELLKKHSIAIVFIDVFLPDGNGLDLLAGLALLPEPPEAIVVTAQGDPQGAENAITAGAWNYIQKPAHMGEIVLMVQQALQAHERKKQTPDGEGTAGIIGSSRAIAMTLLQMFDAAQVDAPVLITGETGTGKELVARAVHQNSRRAKGPFVVVDCSAIAPTLLESELFGNVRGAFTGAMNSRQGLAMLANQGTLFLDEVGELAPEQQKVFLRLLQERRFRPIGSTEELQSDFRVVAATNRNLTEMAAGGTFRSDLLFRLQGLTIEIPPLRSRGKDVFLLVQYALNRTLAQYGMKPKVFSSEALEALASYSWPGNVRELLHAVDAATLATHDGPLILLQHLPMHVRAQAVRSRIEEHNPSFPMGLDSPVTGFDPLKSAFMPAPPRDGMIAAENREAASYGPASSFLRERENGNLYPEAAPPDQPPESFMELPDRSSPPSVAFPEAPSNSLQVPEQADASQSAPALRPMMQIQGNAGAPPERSLTKDPSSWKEFQDTVLYEQKRRYLLDLLTWAQGNVPEAAKVAGLSRQRLYTLLKEHGIMRQWEK